MNRSQRWLLVLLAATVVLGGLWQLVPLRDAQDRLAALPMRGIGYEGIALELDAAEKATFGEAKVLKRVYRVGPDTFTVMVIDGTRNRHAVHDPMLCVRGGGWQIAQRQPFPLAGGSAERVRIVKGETTSEVLYWFSDGSTRDASAWSYWLRATLRRLTCGAAGEEPVLVLLQPAPGTAIDWRRLLDDRLLALTAF